MKNSTRKAKGGAFERFILGEIKEHLDPKAKQTNASGAGLDKNDIYCPSVNWELECKNHRHLTITEWIEQIKLQKNDYNTSILVFKHAKSPDIRPEPYCVISLYDLIKLYKENSVVVTEEQKDNRELNWKLQTCIRNFKELLKELDK